MDYKASYYSAIQDPLEKCLYKKIIDKAGYIAGLRFRWLSSLQLNSFKLISHKLGRVFAKSYSLYKDSGWNIDRLNEYQYIERELRYNKGRDAIYAVCIYQYNPSFLEINNNASEELIKKTIREKAYFQSGIDMLRALSLNTKTFIY
ncbi:hypothetical protein Cyrtocomes_00162 [Candidatus Cyrtobacter comes]|uniref:Uncharacterized protein n=1 Tax=Candidatus Cyrtobacter comes TaxID=675776 RepID=A0ABU5L6Q5_9RICK|nr:hypothetical protein [Candidatus Cyrtobacter comes]MDZ5761804.1 hypothetical protein [Candidatus Cyrtobacter comes]